ncbi:MAG TPA: MmgE/PrpD family protein [Rubrivivax sp.]|nr:MmgE/PrpD family protein [Rubrivivax sp.]
MNPIASYADWLSRSNTPWSEAALATGRDCLRDVIGCLVAGSRDVATQAVAAPLLQTRGPCTVVGRADGLPAPWAALVNGTAAHALDFDDNYTPGMAHSSAVLVPAVLAVGEQRGVSGAALLDAFLAGLEVMAGVGFAVNPIHRQRGWHATSTVGAVAAAGACARIMRLDAGRTAHALAIATSLAGGSMQQFGTMTKPLHAGLAAQAGVLAAQWAEAGLTGSPDALDGPYGLQRLLVGSDLEAQQAKGTGYEERGFTLRFSALPEASPFAVERHPPLLKLWPNCASAHPAVQLMLELRAQHGLQPAAVRGIVARTRPHYLANLRYTRPANAMQARFSLEHAVAVALLRGKVVLSDFEEAALTAPDVQAAWTCVRREALDGPPSVEAQLDVSLHDGTVLHAELLDGQLIGEPGTPIPQADLLAKFRSCCSVALAPAATAQLERWLGHPQEQPDLAALVDGMAGRCHLTV